MRKMVFSLDPDAIGRLRVEPRGRTFPHSAAFPPVLSKLSTVRAVRQQFVESFPPGKLGWNAQP